MKWIERGIWGVAVVTLSVMCARENRDIRSLTALVKAQQDIMETDRKVIAGQHSVVLKLIDAAKKCDIAGAIDFQTLMMLAR